mgnify:CR=1 FL=1
MNRTLRRTTLGVMALTGLPIMKAAWVPTGEQPSRSEAPASETVSRPNVLAQVVHQAVSVATGTTDTASAITACTGGYTGPGCTTPTPTPRPATPTPTPRPTTNPGGGGTSGGGTGGGGLSSGGANCDVADLSNPVSAGASCSQANGTSSNLFGEGGIFQTIANTLIFLIGAVSVIFLIIGGLRYVISQGDKSGVEQAKNTILYSVIGIVVAVVSFAIVSFLLSALAKSG